MPTLAQSAVTVNDSWNEGGNNCRKFRALDVTLNLTGQGDDTTNTIPASLFGLKRVRSARAFRDATNVAVSAGPSYDGTKLIFYSVETSGSPVGRTGVYKGVVTGAP